MNIYEPFKLNNKIEFFDYNYLSYLEYNVDNLNEKEYEYLLSWIIYRVKTYLPDGDYTSLCGYASDLACTLLNNLHIKANKINIRPMLTESKCIHAVTITDKYILDPTFRQFLNNKNKLNKYLSQNEKGIIFGNNLLNKGFFEITNDNLKIYLDAFIRWLNEDNEYILKYKIRTGEEYRKNLYSHIHSIYDVCDEISIKPSEIAKIKQLKKEA